MCSVFRFSSQKTTPKLDKTKKKKKVKKRIKSSKWDWNCIVGWAYPYIPIFACSWGWRNNCVAHWRVFLAHTEDTPDCDKHTCCQTRCWSRHSGVNHPEVDSIHPEHDTGRTTDSISDMWHECIPTHSRTHTSTLRTHAQLIHQPFWVAADNTKAGETNDSGQ